MHPFFGINGNTFYLEEFAQYIFDKFADNVFVYNLSALDREKLYDRYDFIVKSTNTINTGDIIISSFHILNNLDNEMINKVDKIFIMESANTFDMVNCIKHAKIFNAIKNRKKFYLLTQPEFTKVINSAIFEDRIININRGFYFNHYIHSNNNDNVDNWLLYTNDTANYIYKKDIICDTIKYCNANKLKYIDSKKIVNNYNPANTYKGLLYLRQKDFMPRLPYEFWFYNKPVIFFDISDGLLRVFNETEIPLYTEIIKNNTMITDLTNMIKEISC